MRVTSFVRFAALGLLVALNGCGGQPAPVHVEVKVNEPSDKRDKEPVPIVVKGDASQQDAIVKLLDLPSDKAPQLSKAERCDAALLEALDKMADRKYADALAALEKAREIQDGEQVRNEI